VSIPGEVHVLSAGERLCFEPFDMSFRRIRRKGVVHAVSNANDIDIGRCTTGALIDDITGVVYMVDVVAGATPHCILATHAIENIDPVVADEIVVQLIAGQVDLQTRCAARLKRLHIGPGTQRIARAGISDVCCTLCRAFLDHGSRIVDVEDIVARTAFQGVLAETSGQCVVIGATAQGVCAIMASEAIPAFITG
jgi:hypothetical protein